MKNTSLLLPLFKTIDKVFFGIEDINELENQPDINASVNDEEFDEVSPSKK